MADGWIQHRCHPLSVYKAGQGIIVYPSSRESFIGCYSLTLCSPGIPNCSMCARVRQVRSCLVHVNRHIGCAGPLHCSHAPQQQPYTRENEIPAHYVCPITLGVMRDPVITPSGNSYERFSSPP